MQTDKTYTLRQRSFVTNLHKDIDQLRMLRIAKTLGVPAWFGEARSGMPYHIGFYVHVKYKDLSQYWEIIGEMYE